MEMDFETGARTDEPEHGQVAWIMTDEQLVRLAYAWNSFGLNEFGWETDNGWFDFHQVIKWKPIENPEEIRLRARVRELEDLIFHQRRYRLEDKAMPDKCVIVLAELYTRWNKEGKM